MESRRPESVTETLVTLLAEGDIDGIVSLYEDAAVFADFDGVAVGPSQIRAAHRKFLGLGLTLQLNRVLTFEADDIALVHWAWTVVGRDGSSNEGISAEVLRRQADGSWKFIIDNSDGAALVGLL
ncbi:MAG: nuclear transport factor 2 family protein [Acidimicrobiia bacterium]